MKPRLFTILLLVLLLLTATAAATAPEGYPLRTTLEDIQRQPQPHVSAAFSLQGDILTVLELEGQFEYVLALRDHPDQVFVALYTLPEGAPLLRPGDAVTVYGVFTGLSPFTGTESLKEGAPILAAEGILPLQTDSPVPAIGTMDQPAPIGTPVIYPGDVFTDYASLEITLTNVLRGSAALKRAKEMSNYNVNPTRAQEYILIYLKVRALEVPNGRASLGNEDFFFVSAAGSEYRQHFLINPPSSLSPLYKDGLHEAVISCLIQKGDQPLLVFMPQSQTPLWFNPNSP